MLRSCQLSQALFRKLLHQHIYIFFEYLKAQQPQHKMSGWSKLISKLLILITSSTNGGSNTRRSSSSWSAECKWKNHEGAAPTWAVVSTPVCISAHLERDARLWGCSLEEHHLMLQVCLPAATADAYKHGFVQWRLEGFTLKTYLDVNSVFGGFNMFL